MACANINDEDELVGIFNNLNVNPMAIISQSQKGHPQLCFNGYQFRVSSLYER